MYLTVPLLIALVGLLMYVLATNGKLVEIGRILFFCGALVATAQATEKMRTTHALL